MNAKRLVIKTCHGWADDRPTYLTFNTTVTGKRLTDHFLL